MWSNKGMRGNDQLMQNRRMVSFDDSLRVEQPIEAELDDMITHGFNSVVFCITETDLQQRAAAGPNKSVLVTMLEMAKQKGLYVGVDPWNMGNIFGGESVSAIGSAKWRDGKLIPQKANPFGAAFDSSWRQFLDIAGRGGADFVFMDEPELARRYSRSALYEFIDERTEQAHEHGLLTDVCLTVNHLETLGSRVVKLAHVDGISTDLIYSGGEYTFSKLPGSNDDVTERYIGRNAEKVQKLASAACKQAGVWIQGHSISAGHEETTIRDKVLEAAKHVGSVGYWRTHYSNIRPVNHELAWQIAGEAFRGVGFC